jgi:TonB dependent receptor-like, beta-barrel/Carboxypeptidase regulatory-like domain
VGTGRTLALLILISSLITPGLLAQTPAESAVIDATVSTQSTIRLTGAIVEVRDDAARVVGRQITDGEGRVRFTGLTAGRYRLVASLEGFQTTEFVTMVNDGETATVAIDLPIAVVASVDVVAAAPLASETIGRNDAISSKAVEEYAGRDGLQAALQLLATVIMVPGGVSIKGGRPGQAGTQIGSGTLVDPSTGFVRFTFPADAIDSVAVLPNPYAVEYGRFSSGLVVIRTRRAALDKWKTRVGHLEPSLHNKRHQPFHFTGLESWGPWVETGGPLIGDRLFIEQSVQYRYDTNDVPSRPEDERQITHWLSTFTRVDANLSAKHSLVGTVGFFPSKRLFSMLGTFTPPDATVDLYSRANNGALTERSVWTDSLVSESTLQVQQFSTEVRPHGLALMELLPETTLGNFYNSQQRDTATVQWIHTLSGTRQGLGGLHSLKAGVDLLYTDYAGSSTSRPVLIRRSDGLLVRRLDFAGPTRQSVQSTDVAVFAQDRLQLRPRWLLEFGGRLDRDGIVGGVTGTPRIGTVILLNETGGTLLRGGYGLFYERMPSVAGAFSQFEREIDTRYGADGATPLGPPVTFEPRSALGTSPPRSATWDVSFEHRFNKMWAIHASYLDRRGSNELVVQPILDPTGAGEMRLDSSGRSVYHDAEIGVQFNRPLSDFTVTYIRSMARTDLNTLTNFYDTLMWPVIGSNSYAPANTDVPHRLFARGRYQPTTRWLIAGVADWRTGFPYSVVDERLDFVGPRNEIYRFPNRFTADLGIEHHFTGFKWKPWIGLRFYNAFDSFIPADVQNNLSSPFFGSFYNSEIQQIRLQLRFER